jgi:protein dithiol oxidoreductase (disulfide-forming)
MTRSVTALLFTLALSITGTANAQALFQPGRHYDVLKAPQRTNVSAGKVEVMEVFSYGCPACDHFQPTIKKLKTQLPANAQLVYLPASWNAAENWPTLQRAYLTAQSLGIADKAHEEMFRAIWSTGELAVVDLNTGKPKTRLPTMDDIARFYQRVGGVKPADFVNTSKSFGIDARMRAADAQIIAMQVSGTPTIIVNGKYRVNNEAFRTPDEIVSCVKFLVAKESVAAAPPAPAPAKKS